MIQRDNFEQKSSVTHSAGAFSGLFVALLSVCKKNKSRGVNK
jgi:hypothetical protein